MSSLVGTYASGAALLEALHAFLTVGHTLRPQYSGVGNGYSDDLIGTVNSVYELITVTLNSSTTFTVAGSASGNMGSGTVGVLFTHDRFKFTLIQGTTPFAAGDSLIVQMTPPWSILGYSAGQSYIYSAPGDDGNQNVNVGWTVKSNVTGGYFNARIGAYPTWFSTSAQWRKWDYQWWPLGSYIGSAVKLWAVASGQYIYAVARIGTVYSAMCAGYIDSVHTTDQFPAPYCVGGSLSFSSEPADTSTAWAYNGSTLQSPVHPYKTPDPVPPSNVYANGIGTTLHLRNFGNVWSPVARDNYSNTSFNPVSLSPLELDDSYFGTDWRNCARNLDDSIPLYPIKLQQTYDGGYSRRFDYGFLPFVYKFPVYDKNGTIISSESTFRNAATRVQFVVLNTGTNVTYNLSYYALELI